MRGVPGNILACVTGLFLLSCSGIERNLQLRPSDSWSSEKPGRIHVYDFASRSADRAFDEHATGTSAPDSPSRSTKDERTLGDRVAGTLSAQIVEALAQRGLFAEKAPGSPNADKSVLVIKGHFLTGGSCEPGQGRFVGVDSDEMSAQVQVFQRTTRGLRQVMEFAVTSESCRELGPDRIPEAGANEAQGNIRRLRHMAEETTKTVADYYVSMGWLRREDAARSETGR